MTEQSPPLIDIGNQLAELADVHGPRCVIAAVARHYARAHQCKEPSAFREDPVTAPELVAAIAEMDVEALPVDALGQTWETLLTKGERRQQGAHFTPTALCDHIVALGLAEMDVVPETIWDPACGGGAFLLAAARWLATHTDRTRSEIVCSLFATDIDQTALDVCDATLEIWCLGRQRPRSACVDALLDLPSTWPTNVDAVVGNPPFLGQLTSDTVRGNHRRNAIQRSFESAHSAYLDDAGLFVELSLQHVRQGGRVVLVLPQSLLGARDAEVLRRLVQTHARLRALWVDEGQSFAAAVDVVAVVIETEDAEAPTALDTALYFGLERREPLTVEPQPEATSWAPLLASALGVPRVDAQTSGELGDLATVTAGFRQHFYGIADAVREATPDARGSAPKLITSGAVEPLRSLWGQRLVRFSGTTWNAPVVQLDAIDDPKVQAWFEDRCRPKLLLASQTKVIEVVADPEGDMVPSVPVVSVEPSDDQQLWRIAAALTSPFASAWMIRAAAGTGLSHDAIRVRAATLKTLPLPHHLDDWDSGAELARQVHAASGAGDDDRYVSLLGDLAKTMNAAYGVGSHIGEWWRERLRLPPGLASVSHQDQR